MTTKLTIYKPSDAVAPEDRGVDVTVKVVKDNVNNCLSVGQALLDIATQEGLEQAGDRRKFLANFEYLIPGGLVMRLWDDGKGMGNEALEFVALDESEPARSQALARLPQLLARAGVEHSALVELRESVAVGRAKNE